MFRSDAGRLAIVHQRCAGHLTTRVTARINWRACSRVVLAESDQGFGLVVNLLLLVSGVGLLV
jgi:hypothetical protein